MRGACPEDKDKASGQATLELSVVQRKNPAAPQRLPPARQCVPQHRAPSHLLCMPALGLNDQLGHVPKDTFSM